MPPLDQQHIPTADAAIMERGKPAARQIDLERRRQEAAAKAGLMPVYRLKQIE